MKIKIKIKHFNGSDEREKAFKVAEELGLKRFSALSLSRDEGRPPEGEHVIDLAFVLENQYNTESGFRVFEFHDPLTIAGRGGTRPTYYGYYIAEGIEAIREYQKDLKVCSYCGAQYYKTGEKYCFKCAGSEYLTEKDYPLLRLRNIHEEINSEPLPPEMVELIQTEQRKSRSARLEKKKADKLQSLKNEIADAETEYKAFRWLIENDIDYENVIFYSHTGRFCFGWRNALTRDEAKKLEEKLMEFPFSYELKTGAL